MRSWNDVKVVICAACLVGIAACSEDDPSTETGNLLPAGGTAGASGAAGRGGSAGTSAGGSATAGSSAGGSANAGIAGAAGAAGAAGSGAEPEADAGGDPSEADAGAEPVAPDAGGEVVVDPPVDVDPPAEELSFEADVQPIFAASCGACHTTAGFGGHNVGGALPGSFNDAIELGQTLLVRISGGPTGGMPQGECADDEVPGDPGCLTVAQVQTVADWIEQGSLP